MFTPVSSPPLSPILTPVTALPLMFREMDEGPKNQWYDFPMSRASISLRKVYLHFDDGEYSERSIVTDEFGDHVVRGQLPRQGRRTVVVNDKAFGIVIQHMIANHATNCAMTVTDTEIAISYVFDNVPARTVVADIK